MYNHNCSCNYGEFLTYVSLCFFSNTNSKFLSLRCSFLVSYVRMTSFAMSPFLAGTFISFHQPQVSSSPRRTVVIWLEHDPQRGTFPSWFRAVMFPRLHFSHSRYISIFHIDAAASAGPTRDALKGPHAP